MSPFMASLFIISGISPSPSRVDPFLVACKLLGVNELLIAYVTFQRFLPPFLVRDGARTLRASTRERMRHSTYRARVYRPARALSCREG